MLACMIMCEMMPSGMYVLHMLQMHCAYEHVGKNNLYLDVRTRLLKVLNNKYFSLDDKLSLPTGQLLQV